VPEQNVAVKLQLPAAASNSKPTTDDVATSTRKSARTSASGDSSKCALDKSPTSINDVDCASATAPESVRARAFNESCMSRSTVPQRLHLEGGWGMSRSIQSFEPLLLDIPAVAKALSATIWCVRELLWSKQLPYIKLGRKFLVDPSDLRVFVAQLKSGRGG
jgi:hypothetical protein